MTDRVDVPMTMAGQADTAPINVLLEAWSNGDESALSKLTPLIYADMSRLARQFVSREQPTSTLDTGDILHEAFLRLARWKTVRCHSESHFFGLATQVMRRVLVDHARYRKYCKRGGESRRVALDEAVILSPERSSDLVALDEALQRLASVDDRTSRVVELRVFGGFSVDETAQALQVSRFIVSRAWAFAKVWLRRELGGCRQGRSRRSVHPRQIRKYPCDKYFVPLH